MSWYAHFSLHRSQVGSAGSLHRGEFLVGSLRRSMVPWVELPRPGEISKTPSVSWISWGPLGFTNWKCWGIINWYACWAVSDRGLLSWHILASWMGNILAQLIFVDVLMYFPCIFHGVFPKLSPQLLSYWPLEPLDGSLEFIMEQQVNKLFTPLRVGWPPTPQVYFGPWEGLRVVFPRGGSPS